MRSLLRTLRVLLFAVLAIGAVIAVRTWRAGRAPARAPLSVPAPDVDPARATTHLSEALRFETVSHDDRSDPVALEALRAWLIERYPRFHGVTHRTLVAEGTLVHEWPGSDATLAPIILMAHQDVVPVASAERWRYPPFSGAVADGAVWGRGALDDKGSLIAMLEAAESLAGAGHAPERTLYFVFGHDEESAGSGARAAAQWLARRNVRAVFVLDEGSSVLEDHPLTGEPAVLIAVAEKGMLTLELSVTGTGGHSSAPPPQTAADSLAQAIVAIKQRPFPARYAGTTRDMLDALAPHVSLGIRLAIANAWLFEPLLTSAMRATAEGNAMLQTTGSTTMLSGSPKLNVLPTLATATMNFRLQPGDTTAGVLAHVRDAVRDLPVAVTPVGVREEPSRVSSTSGPGYTLIAGVAAAMFDAPVAPLQTLPYTDSRAMRDIADAIYRFLPFRIRLADVATIHGTDESLSTENLTRAVKFYQQIILGGSARQLP